MFQILHFEKPIPFMRFAKSGMVFSALLTILALFCLFDRGLNWGLDFTGGTTIEVGFQQSVSLDKMHEALDQQKIDGATLQFFGSSRDVLIRLPLKPSQSTAAIGTGVMEALDANAPGAQGRHGDRQRHRAAQADAARPALRQAQCRQPGQQQPPHRETHEEIAAIGQQCPQTPDYTYRANNSTELRQSCTQSYISGSHQITF